MRQYRLRTIMALIGVIAVSLWCGMPIERARQPARTTFTTYGPLKTTMKTYAVTKPLPRASSDGAKP
jgi:hypothetical protein